MKRPAPAAPPPALPEGLDREQLVRALVQYLLEREAAERDLKGLRSLR